VSAIVRTSTRPISEEHRSKLAKLVSGRNSCLDIASTLRAAPFTVQCALERHRFLPMTAIRLERAIDDLHARMTSPATSLEAST
jgi:hypothetical protein